jgi:beta-lactam-binding protein with PASTA domain
MVALPKLVGSTLPQAQAALAARGLRWKISYRTSRLRAGTVITQSRKGGTAIPRGTVIVLVIASAPPPPPQPPPPQPPPPPAVPTGNCDPAYPEVCLHDGIGDYDCAGGSGNGPNYVDGPLKVLPPDPFGLDRDGNGTGCE